LYITVFLGSQVWFVYGYLGNHEATERNITVGSNTEAGPLTPGVLVEICIALLCSKQNANKTATMLRFRNRLTVNTGHWLTQVTLHLIQEKLSLRTSIDPSPGTT